MLNNLRQKFHVFWLLLLPGVFLLLSPAQALTLDEYGVQLTANGIVDNDTGLRWLNASLTAGTPAALEPYFTDGWRIATEFELQYLLTRTVADGAAGGVFSTTLDYSEYLVLVNALDLVPGDLGGPDLPQPWLCRSTFVDAVCGQSSGPNFISFLLNSAADPGSGFPSATTLIEFYVYISEVELYGALFDPPCDGMCTGRSMLVRAVPLPSALWLLLSGVVFLRVNRM